MDENTLISKVKNNDDVAYGQLLEIYERMIYSLVNEHNLLYGDYKISREDLFQEGCIGLLEACKKYNIRDEAHFSSFAYVVIKRKINRAFHKMIEPYFNETYSFDKVEYQDRLLQMVTNKVEDNPIAYCADKEEKLEIKRKLKQLKPLDREILRLRFEGYSYKQIAEELKKERKYIDNRLYRLRKRYLNNEDLENVNS